MIRVVGLLIKNYFRAGLKTQNFFTDVIQVKLFRYLLREREREREKERYMSLIKFLLHSF